MSMMKTEREIAIELCDDTRKLLLAHPNAWIRKTDARNKAGEKVSIYDRSAECFCLSGAARRAAFNMNCTVLNNAGLFRASKAFAEATYRVINKKLDRKVLDIQYYNDKIAKSLWDVIAILCAVRRELEASL